jgi:hypothetical protein
MNDPIAFTYADARTQLLIDGMALTTEQKVAWLEEMMSIAGAVAATMPSNDRTDGIAPAQRPHPTGDC